MDKPTEMTLKQAIEGLTCDLEWAEAEETVLIPVATLALKVVLDALKPMNTEPCEWCEVAMECEYEVAYFEVGNRHATHKGIMPKFCPNCGRKLKGEKE